MNLSEMQAHRGIIRNKMKTQNVLQKHNNLSNRIRKKPFVGALVVVVGLFLFWWIWGNYDMNYWKNIGDSYNAVLQKFGEPIKVEIDTTCFKAYFENMNVVCYDNGSTYLAEITDPDIRFGILKIGVGTPKRVVEGIYHFKRKFIDLDENEFGVNDGVVSITFEYDENDCVKKMYLCNWYW